MHRPSLLAPVLLLLLPAAALRCQRKDAVLDWQKRTSTISYGVVPLGKHTIDELQVGTAWRLGMNEASTWNLEAPLLVGDRVLPAGGFRIGLLRRDKDQFSVVLTGSAQALGAAGGDLEVPCTLGDAPKAAPKLELAWTVPPKGQATGDNQPATLTVSWGAHQLQGKVTSLGANTAKAGAYVFELATLPAAPVAGRDRTPLPVGVLRRKANGKAPVAWNLVLDQERARLVPLMAAPTDSFGFAEPTPPDAAWIATGSVATTGEPEQTSAATLTLQGLKLDKGQLTMTLGCGKQTLIAAVPEPKGKP